MTDSMKIAVSTEIDFGNTISLIQVNSMTLIDSILKLINYLQTD